MTMLTVAPILSYLFLKVHNQLTISLHLMEFLLGLSGPKLQGESPSHWEHGRGTVKLSCVPYTHCLLYMPFPFALPLSASASSRFHIFLLEFLLKSY